MKLLGLLFLAAVAIAGEPDEFATPKPFKTDALKAPRGFKANEGPEPITDCSIPRMTITSSSALLPQS